MWWLIWGLILIVVFFIIRIIRHKIKMDEKWWYEYKSNEEIRNKRDKISDWVKEKAKNDVLNLSKQIELREEALKEQELTNILDQVTFLSKDEFVKKYLDKAKEYGLIEYSEVSRMQGYGINPLSEWRLGQYYDEMNKLSNKLDLLRLKEHNQVSK